MVEALIGAQCMHCWLHNSETEHKSPHNLCSAFESALRLIMRCMHNLVLA